jgi:hypothetical protein
MPTFSETFKALANEAMFTKEMLGAGATQIRKANYATRGIYFQAFTSLATGLERIGKLCLMIDHYIETGGKFPDLNYMKKEICHDLSLIYNKSQSIVECRAISFDFLKSLDHAIHQNILKVLSDFNEGDRYSNINLLVGRKGGDDPVSIWYENVDKVIFDTVIRAPRKSRISHNARLVEEPMGPIALVRHTSETGTDITTVEEASFRTGLFEAVAPRRQLFVLQIIRYWVELLRELQFTAMKIGKEEIPFFDEIFSAFYNDDAYIKTRKTWDTV